MYRNFAQKWVVFAFDETTGIEQIDDQNQITANIRIDGGSPNAIDDVNPTQLEDGYYVFDVTAAETDGSLLLICPVSSTADIQVVGVPGSIYTHENVICGISDGAGSTTTIVTSLETTHSLATNDALNGRVVIFDANTTTVALRQQAGEISAYNGSSGLITVTAGSAFTTSPANGDTFNIY